ncbi:hypothetical protein [Streptacidiphilus melanogenes]|uniref:hypothetical protein n=1 Tax=Streptacidiphilus melanogenes TaxID=411235 RepID=UPI0005AB370A|nr:hypothetical protein [Streptacidiphilus melanogenes]
MLKLGRTKRAIAMGAAALALAGGATVTTAGSASATSLVCYTYNGASSAPCSHQTTLYANNSAWNSPAEFWTDAMVLKVQNDGNLVLYCQGHGSNRAVWASNTSGLNIDHGRLVFWNDGNLAMYEAPFTDPSNYMYAWDAKVWGGSQSIAVLQADGNFVIWSGGKAMWASNTYHACPGTQNYWVGYQ